MDILVSLEELEQLKKDSEKLKAFNGNKCVNCNIVEAFSERLEIGTTWRCIDTDSQNCGNYGEIVSTSVSADRTGPPIVNREVTIKYTNGDTFTTNVKRFEYTHVRVEEV